MNTMSCCTINRKAKTCHEIGMLPSVRSVTKVLCFPFRSRNVNVCRVFDPRARNIYLPMREAWITVLSCRLQNISQKGSNRLRRSKKVSCKHWGFQHTHTHKHKYTHARTHTHKRAHTHTNTHTHARDSQGWQHCVVIPLAKHLAGTTKKVEKVKECVVCRQSKVR
jgi:hypothetical protein